MKVERVEQQDLCIGGGNDGVRGWLQGRGSSGGGGGASDGLMLLGRCGSCRVVLAASLSGSGLLSAGGGLGGRGQRAFLATRCYSCRLLRHVGLTAAARGTGASTELELAAWELARAWPPVLRLREDSRASYSSS